MNVRTIQKIEIFYYDLQSGEKENVFELALKRDIRLHELLEGESSEGDLIYEVKFSDGTAKMISHPKGERNEEWQSFKLSKLAQHWSTIYEWLNKRDFKTKRPFKHFSTRYEAEEARSTPEDWEIIKRFSAEEFELRIGPNEEGLDEFQELEENMNLILEYEDKNSREFINEGRYYDYLLEEWINPRESFLALEPFILDITYGNFWGNREVTQKSEK